MIRVQVEDTDGRWKREILIERDERKGEEIDYQDVVRYSAVLISGQNFRRIERFQHRYGDDELTLVAEAIDALGGRGGLHTNGMRRWRS